jgi:hypothetical protein
VCSCRKSTSWTAWFDQNPASQVNLCTPKGVHRVWRLPCSRLPLLAPNVKANITFFSWANYAFKVTVDL